MGVNVQVCWEKFCNFWEVEARQVPMEGDRFHLDPQAAAELCDENTIGVVGILGSTFDGSYEPIAELCAALDALQERTGLDIPVHVDGASGGDGRALPRRGPGLGLPAAAGRRRSTPRATSTAWSTPASAGRCGATADDLPEELVFRVNYLGGDMPTFALNFSRPGAQVVAQYYTFLRLGREGYRAVQQTTRDVARGLAERVEALGDFRLHHPRRPAAGVRLHDRARRDGVRRLRRVAADARARLAGPRVHLPARTARTCRCCGWCAATASPPTWPSCSSTTSSRLLPELREQPHPLDRATRSAATRLPPLTPFTGPVRRTLFAERRTC